VSEEHRGEPQWLQETGRRLRERLSDPEISAKRELTRAAWERIWRRHASTRAEEREVPQDPDVRRIALDREPPRSPAIDSVIEFLAWRTQRAETLGVYREHALLVLLSAAGAGKTCAAAWAATWHRDSALYVTAATVSSNPLTAHSDSHARWNVWRRTDLLVIDEVGLERDASVVLSLLLERHASAHATIVAGNLTPDAFRARYADPRLDSRMAQQEMRGGPALVELPDVDLRTAGGGRE
jgi:hypothetical protein